MLTVIISWIFCGTLALVAAYGLRVTLMKTPSNSTGEKVWGTFVLAVMIAGSFLLAAKALTLCETEVKMPETVLIVRMVTPNPSKRADTLDGLYIERPYLMTSRVSPAMAERLLMQLPAREILIVIPDKDGWRIKARRPDIIAGSKEWLILFPNGSGWTVGDQLSPK